MIKLKLYTYLFLTLLSCFTLGLLAYSDSNTIEIYRIFSIILFSVIALIFFLDKYIRNDKIR